MWRPSGNHAANMQFDAPFANAARSHRRSLIDHWWRGPAAAITTAACYCCTEIDVPMSDHTVGMDIGIDEVVMQAGDHAYYGWLLR
jgi:hypothetical protein